MLTATKAESTAQEKLDFLKAEHRHLYDGDPDADLREAEQKVADAEEKLAAKKQRLADARAALDAWLALTEYAGPSGTAGIIPEEEKRLKGTDTSGGFRQWAIKGWLALTGS